MLATDGGASKNNHISLCIVASAKIMFLYRGLEQLLKGVPRQRLICEYNMFWHFEAG
jgi:hypothetical protein